jgi:hypothetical protein
MVINYPFPAKAVAHIPSQSVAEMAPENKAIRRPKPALHVGKKSHFPSSTIRNYPNISIDRIADFRLGCMSLECVDFPIFPQPFQHFVHRNLRF